MNREDIIRMALEVETIMTGPDDFPHSEEFIEWCERFAALVAAAKQEHIARQWDALHDKYMADPLRRQMMLSYEMVANLIRGRTCSPQFIEGICPDSKAGRAVAELVQVLQEIVQKDLLAGAIKHDARAAIAKATGGEK